MTVHEDVLAINERANRAVLRMEGDLIAEVVAAYEAVMADLRRDIVDRLGEIDASDPAQVRGLATDARLLASIEARLESLRPLVRDLVAAVVSACVSAGVEAIGEQVARIAAALGVVAFPAGVNAGLDAVVDAVVARVDAWVDETKAVVRGALRESLIRGDRVSVIVARVFQKSARDGRPSAFRRGLVSARLFVRRAVIEADNVARLAAMESAREQMPGLRKQAVAVIQARTTATCLAVHGQIRDVNQPFDLTRRPRFERRMMTTPFHWNCRTAIVAYHAIFEEDGTSTAEMRRRAKAEQDGRQK